MFELTINETRRGVDVDGEMPLLWVLRDILDMTGTEYGCGAGLCGACTVHSDGEATRSCITPVAEVGARKVGPFCEERHQPWSTEGSSSSRGVS